MISMKKCSNHSSQTDGGRRIFTKSPERQKHWFGLRWRTKNDIGARGGVNVAIRSSKRALICLEHEAILFPAFLIKACGYGPKGCRRPEEMLYRMAAQRWSLWIIETK
jgi:hypothetical protein